LHYYIFWTRINGNLGEAKQRDGNRSSLFPPAGPVALEAELDRRAWAQDCTSAPSPSLPALLGIAALPCYCTREEERSL